MAGVRTNPQKNGKYVGWYRDRFRQQRFFAGTNSKRKTLEMAQRLEDEEREIRLGYRPEPTAAQIAASKMFQEVLDEYMLWGKSHGGRGGRPWAKEHSRKRLLDLNWWKERLNLRTVSDFDGMLPRAERALLDLHGQGKSGKTLHNRRESLLALIHWMIDHEYLDKNPLTKLRGYDTTPKIKRRTMTAEELQAFFAHCRPKWKLLYQVAICTGLRRGELAALRTYHLEREKCGLRLESSWTKNRRSGFQPLPRQLFDALLKEAKDKKDDAPLLRVPRNAVEVLERDLTLAGIKKSTLEGKIDFHSLRTVYINLVITSGANVKEAQDLARHVTPELTMNVYGRSSEDRKTELTEMVGRVVMGQKEK